MGCKMALSLRLSYEQLSDGALVNFRQILTKGELPIQNVKVVLDKCLSLA